MSGLEKGYDTNHIMNFIIGFLVVAVYGNILLILNSNLYSLEELRLLALIFGILCGIIGFIVGLVIDVKNEKLRTNMFLGVFTSVVLGLIWYLLFNFLRRETFEY